MALFRVILKVPATLYAYHDIEAASEEELTERLSKQEEVNTIVGEGIGYVSEFAEPDENHLDWSLDEIVGTNVTPLVPKVTR